MYWCDGRGIRRLYRAEFYLSHTSVIELWLWASAFISHSPLLNLVISGTHTLMSVARRLIEIWTWIIHAPLMSLGSLLTMNSRRVDLDVWCALCAHVGLNAAEVMKGPHIHACCEFYVPIKTWCVVYYHDCLTINICHNRKKVGYDIRFACFTCTVFITNESYVCGPLVLLLLCTLQPSHFVSCSHLFCLFFFPPYLQLL